MKFVLMVAMQVLVKKSHGLVERMWAAYIVDISVISGILVCRAQETNALCPQAGGGRGHDEDSKLQQDGAVLEDMNAGDSDSELYKDDEVHDSADIYM